MDTDKTSKGKNEFSSLSVANNFCQSKKFRIVLAAVGCLIVLIIVFKTGEFVGYRKARFFERWGENYHRNFGGPRDGFFPSFRYDFDDSTPFGASFSAPSSIHGVFGTIIKIDNTASSTFLTVKGEDNMEKIVSLSDNTTIVSRRDIIKASELKIDDRVAVIGAPNEQGQIEAKFIRVFR